MGEWCVIIALRVKLVYLPRYKLKKLSQNINLIMQTDIHSSTHPTSQHNHMQYQQFTSIQIATDGKLLCSKTAFHLRSSISSAEFHLEPNQTQMEARTKHIHNSIYTWSWRARRPPPFERRPPAARSPAARPPAWPRWGP